MKLLPRILGGWILLLIAPALASDHELDPAPPLKAPPKLMQPKLNSPPKIGGYEGLPDLDNKADEKEAEVEEAEVEKAPKREWTTIVMVSLGLLIVLFALKEAFS